jgi:hypothetical protein
MNCRHCQRELLNSEQPGDPGLELSAHLAGCMECRDFQRQLLVIEANLPRVPVPAAAPLAKARLLAHVLGQAAPTNHVASHVSAASRERQLPEANPQGLKVLSGGSRPQLAAPMRLLRSRAVLAAAAAVLVVVGLSLGYWLSRAFLGDSGVTPEQAQNNTPSPKPPPADPFGNKKSDKGAEFGKVSPVVAKLMEDTLKLAENGKEAPQERVLALAELADVLQAEVRALARKSSAAELGKLAAMYRTVVLNGLVAKAKDLPMAERREILDGVVQQLEQTSKSAEQLAKTAPAAREALQLIASAARDGDAQLRQLMEGTE